MNFDDESIASFLDGIASEKVVPAGGTAAAVVGAIGTALCEMACLHTDAAPGADSGGSAFDELTGELRGHRSELLDLADRDATAVDALVTGSPDQSAHKRATGVPLAIAEACLTVLEAAPEIAAKGNPIAVPDAVTGAYLAYAAVQTAVYTVRSNVGEITDSSFTAEVLDRVADIETSAQTALEAVLANAEERT